MLKLFATLFVLATCLVVLKFALKTKAAKILGAIKKTLLPKEKEKYVGRHRFIGTKPTRIRFA